MVFKSRVPFLFLQKITAGMYNQIIKPFLFNFNAESAHKIATTSLNILDKIPGATKLSGFHQKLDRTFFEYKNLRFKGPIGLAAGFDKNGDYLHPLAKLGFSFIELGTVTPKPQDGNPKPRLFRLPADKALINRMGFNNKGVDHLVERLKNRPKNVIIGGNIGKNKITPNEKAQEDYKICFEKLYDHVDYFVINVSSPNTPELRKLQNPESLAKIFEPLVAYRAKQDLKIPILLKIAPDLEQEDTLLMVQAVNKFDLDGIIATNTTIDRSGLKTKREEVEALGAGGLSGQPLTHKSLEVIKSVRLALDTDKLLIGVGGISTVEQAESALKAGADLVQIYTSFIYEGPGLVHSINKKIV
jgi:dihydroorotate dehydrogenase